MPGVARRDTDAAVGVAFDGSSNVFVNSFGVVRIGDRVQGHGLPPHSPSPPMIEGSENVFVNGIGVVRAGDSASCGDIISGSDNVSVN